MTDKIIGISGSRNFTNYKLFCQIVNEWIELLNFKPDLIVHGGCRGTDALAEKYAADNNIPCSIELAEWNVYGNAAGPIRNKKIIERISYLFAFPSKNGKGTQNAINFAKKKKIKICIYDID